MQAASARRSDLVWSAKARNVRPCGSVTSASDGASSASAMLSGKPTPSTSWMPSPPSTIERTRSGMLEREERGDARAHRIAHDVGAVDAEMIEQRAHVVGHCGRCDSRPDRRAWSTGRARDCRARSRGGRRALSVATQPGWTQFTSLRGGEAVHEHDRLALALVEIGDLDGAVVECRHAGKIETRNGAGSSPRRRHCRIARLPLAPACAARWRWRRALDRGLGRRHEAEQRQRSRRESTARD